MSAHSMSHHATGKSAYKITGTARVPKLPPIREESAVSLKSPRGQITTRKGDVSGHVKTLPVIDGPQEKKKVTFTDYTLFSDQYFYHTPKPIYEYPRSSVEPNQTLIDGVVADYLHFARYGHIIPVYEGTSTTACPCCNERNKQNVQSLLGIPRKNATWSEAWKVPRDKSGEQTKTPDGLIPRYQKPPLENWLNYQPLTYAHNYLNPEFNRPTAVYNYYTDRAYDSGDPYVSNQIISADNRFDESMKRLHKYGNESS